jgi:hypothetical protein
MLRFLRRWRLCGGRNHPRRRRYAGRLCHLFHWERGDFSLRSTNIPNRQDLGRGSDRCKGQPNSPLADAARIPGRLVKQTSTTNLYHKPLPQTSTEIKITPVRESRPGVLTFHLFNSAASISRIGVGTSDCLGDWRQKTCATRKSIFDTAID